jgi:hypothetical protein
VLKKTPKTTVETTDDAPTEETKKTRPPPRPINQTTLNAAFADHKKRLSRDIADGRVAGLELRVRPLSIDGRCARFSTASACGTTSGPPCSATPT